MSLHPSTPPLVNIPLITSVDAKDVSDLIVDKCHPAGQVFTSVDAYQHAEVCDELSSIKHPHLHHELSYVDHLAHYIEHPHHLKLLTSSIRCAISSIFMSSTSTTTSNVASASTVVSLYPSSHVDNLRYNFKRRRQGDIRMHQRWGKCNVGLEIV